MWYFYCLHGTFTIAVEPSGSYGLWFDTEKLGSYPLPEAAAEAVAKQKTGLAAWDDLPNISAPGSLADWMAMRTTAR